ncbi:hypothetical protein [Lutibacter sp.]|uniref:hypothetical protein n=1 Tax=Lutibacter sp. TaxID=1925666 RepID=UPI001A22802B|nr:hypothetical protein [Lutibacter sp.]MBI9041536.1 hypothetical protein [Lutibacter sp.]
MKNLKTLGLLICLTTFLISCEKDATEVLDNAALQETEATQPQNSKISFLDLLKNNTLTTKSAKKLQNLQSRIEEEELEAVAEFYLNDAESFNCSGSLTTEDFNNIDIERDIIEVYNINGVLDENTSYGNEEMMYIEPGDIVSGIQFSTQDEYNWIFANSYTSGLENLNIDNTFFNISAAPLEITFESYNINAITADLILLAYSSTMVYAVDSEDNYLGHIIIDPTYNEFEEEEMIEFTKELLYIKSPVPIKKLYMYTNDYYMHYAPNFIGLDAISFGQCISDADNDGVLDNEDPYPNSNLSETLFIDEINTSILNKFTKTNGVTMADEMDNLINLLNAQYTGDNYNQLHKKFVSEVAKLSYYWYKSRLITSRERSKISSFAWSTSVPYFQEIG